MCGALGGSVQNFISVRVLSLRELFSGEFDFRLPWFQRAYAWQPGEVGRLLTDIFDALEFTGGRRRYFLGNIMLAKQPDNPDTALVDGHQRIMTLTILFAVLRDLARTTAERMRLQELIAGQGIYRLTPQEVLRDFVEGYVQKMGATQLELEENPADLSETERNVIENRDYLLRELSHRDVPAELLIEMAAFLADHCYLTVSIVRDENEAWRFLQVEEDTRHRFSLTNRAKSSLLAIIPAAEREACRKIWERAEQLLGAEDMFGLLGYLRTLLARKVSDKPVDAELAQIANLNRDGLRFVTDMLEPAAKRLSALRRMEAGVPGDRPRIAASVERMSWIAPNAWLPAGMLWLEKRRDSRETVLFFARLERLMWILRLAGVDPSRQQKQLLRLLAEIDKGTVVADMRELLIGASVRDDALTSLRAPSFDSRRYASRVLRRIGAELGQDPGPIDTELCTIEHILPSGFLEKSGWRDEFKSARAVKGHAHRLGNLTFLNGKDNGDADSKDWVDKRPIYAQSGFKLASELAGVEHWGARAIEARTERLIRLLFDAWELAV